MKHLILRMVLPLGLAIASSSSWAYVIVGGPSNGVDVGALDTLIEQQFHRGPGSNPAGEQAWAEGILGFSLNYDGKDDPVSIYDTDTANIRAFALSFGPGYYILKNSTYRALFENVASLDWGVIDKSLLDSGFNLNGTTISHVTQFNGDPDPDPDPVPVPGTLLLVGLGLMGLRFVGKKVR